MNKHPFNQHQFNPYARTSTQQITIPYINNKINQCSLQKALGIMKGLDDDDFIAEYISVSEWYEHLKTLSLNDALNKMYQYFQKDFRLELIQTLFPAIKYKEISVIKQTYKNLMSAVRDVLEQIKSRTNVNIQHVSSRKYQRFGGAVTGASPFRASPFIASPFRASPFKASPFTETVPRASSSSYTASPNNQSSLKEMLKLIIKFNKKNDKQLKQVQRDINNNTKCVRELWRGSKCQHQKTQRKISILNELIPSLNSKQRSNKRSKSIKRKRRQSNKRYSSLTFC